MPYQSTCLVCGAAFVVRAPSKPQRFCTKACFDVYRLATRPERFWPKVRKGDGCWEWTGQLNHRGYGQVGGHRHRKATHRTAWELTHGPVPPGLFVLHHCDNPPCCRPDHLFVGTARDNVLDMYRKGRHPGGWGAPHGEKNPNAVLTVEQVRACLLYTSPSPRDS